MGQKGPLPSGRRQRGRDQRRHEANTTVLSGEVRGREAPALPEGLPEAVLEWWGTLWASPIALEYADVDVPGLTRLAMLWGKSVQGGCSAAELSEARQLETAYGLNPTARRRLQWRLERPLNDAAAPSNGEMAERMAAVKGRLDA